MTQYTRIALAFELLKAAVAAGAYYGLGNSSDEKAKYRAEWAFQQADAFIEEAKKQGEEI